VRNSIKNLNASTKNGGKNQERDTSQLSQKTSYWRGNQGGWCITVQRPTVKKKKSTPVVRGSGQQQLDHHLVIKDHPFIIRSHH
jgi:hypothetical protein